MLQVAAEGIVNDGNNVESHFVWQIARLNIPVCRGNDLSLFLSRNGHPRLADLCRLPGFHFYNYDRFVFFRNDVDLVFNEPVIGGENGIAVFEQVFLSHYLAQDTQFMLCHRDRFLLKIRRKINSCNGMNHNGARITRKFLVTTELI